VHFTPGSGAGGIESNVFVVESSLATFGRFEMLNEQAGKALTIHEPWWKVVA
jgi:hypothetical protein